VSDRFRASTIASVLLIVVIACARQGSARGDAPAGSAASAPAPVSAATRVDTSVGVAPAHLQIRETRFVEPGGTPFEWRGISAFRLVEMSARGKHAEVAAYLDWAARHTLTVVRVLTMAQHLFELDPAEGVRALPAVLDAAAKRGLHVEIVALADTAGMPIDLEAHVRAIGAIAARYSNALVEIANEPGHQTQARALHDPDYVQRLAQLIPDGVPKALGSIEYGDGYGGGDYITWHAPRGEDHPITLANGADLLRRFKKPVISDEPIGAADSAVLGRRDDSPARFHDVAIRTKRAGMGATFHYEGGLQAKLPSKIEMACLSAWLEGLNSQRPMK